LKSFVDLVSVDVNLFRQSHSNQILNFRVLNLVYLWIVHHFHQFVFLIQWKRFAINVSVDVHLFRQSHLNQIRNFRV
jgi:hypothetical protein